MVAPSRQAETPKSGVRKNSEMIKDSDFQPPGPSACARKLENRRDLCPLQSECYEVSLSHTHAQMSEDGAMTNGLRQNLAVIPILFCFEATPSHTQGLLLALC